MSAIIMNTWSTVTRRFYACALDPHWATATTDGRSDPDCQGAAGPAHVAGDVVRDHRISERSASRLVRCRCRRHGRVEDAAAVHAVANNPDIVGRRRTREAHGA